jgi:hypothetical protein
MALRFLTPIARIAGIVAALAVTAAITLLAVSLYARGLESASWADSFAVVLFAVELTSLVAATVLTAIATIGSLVSMLRIWCSVSPGTPLWRRMNCILLYPEVLTPAGLQYRRQLITYATIALVAFALGMLGFTLEEIRQRAT